MNVKYLSLLSLSLLLVFSACQKETIDPSDAFGYEYFPIDTGRVTLYNVDTTFYDLFNNTVFTRSWRVKEEIILLDKDSQNNERVRIARSYRSLDAGDDLEYSVPTVHYATRSTTTLDYQDNNLRFIRLTFPVAEEKSWFGNVYINEQISDNEKFYADWNYQYSLVGEPATIGNLPFEETLTVNQVADNPANILSYRFAQEKYAKGVGLIYRKVDNLQLKTGNTADYVGISWPERANEGFSTTWTIVSY